MIKKALADKAIRKYVETNSLKTVDDIMQHLQPIFELLKQHPDHGNLIGQCPYQVFVQEVNRGLMTAQMMKNFGGMNFNFQQGQ